MKTLSIIVTDMGFIVPSMFLAKQLSSSRLRHLTDVMVFVLDAPAEFADSLCVEFSPCNILIKSISIDDLGVSGDYLQYFKGHVPLAALARLAIARNIPARYENIIYFDGDMQIVGDIKPLLRFEAPEGKIAAAVENFVMLEEPDGTRPEWLGNYLESLGLDRAASYFNSGLMLFRRSTWEHIAPRALDYFLANADRCHHHDQSCLNAVCAGDWLPVSPTYNYSTFFLKMGGLDNLRPKLVHFASSPKPWQSAESLWHPRYAESYRQFQHRHPLLSDKLSVYDRELAPTLFGRALRDAKIKAGAVTKRRNLVRNFSRYLRENEFAIV